MLVFRCSILLFCTVLVAFLVRESTCDHDAIRNTVLRRNGGGTKAVLELLERVFGFPQDHIVHRLTLRIDEKMDSDGFVLKDCEEGRKVCIDASGVSELANGVGYYFRTKYLVHFSWNRTGGHQLENSFLDEDRPKPIGAGKVVNITRAVPISYFNNVVTFSYSYVWYTFREWEYLLDWMALSGINLAIAYTGQEEIYRKTFNSFGVSNETFSQWTNGIAYLAWARGQNLHGCAGGLRLKVMTHQWALQKRILTRMRRLGITPVLPTFQGNVPGVMRDLFPQANFSKNGIAWLEGTDPLFQEIQKRYMEILISDWGTDHWYETDGYFNHEDGPWFAEDVLEEGNKYCRYNIDPGMKATRSLQSSSIDPVEPDLVAKKHSDAVFRSMTNVDPKAIWLYQGWIWRGWRENRLSYMKGFVSGVPRGRFVILDMFDEVDPEWNLFDNFAYFDTPFIWSTLHNFGGNTGMWGSLQLLNEQPFQAYKHAKHAIVGTGSAPEGIDQNPVYYNMVTDIHWRSEPYPSVAQYVKDFAAQRYGIQCHLLEQAWVLLSESVYDGETNRVLARNRDWLSGKNSDGIMGLPFGNSMDTPYPVWYNTTKTLEAWKLLIHAGTKHGDRLKKARTFAYDIVNVGREVMAKYSNDLFQSMVSHNDSKLLELMVDVDKLLCTETSWMASPWFEQAMRLAKDIDSSDSSLLYEFAMEARSQTTTWGPQVKDSSTTNSQNLDYGNKQWGGQIGSFYKLRDECFLKHFNNRAEFQKCAAQSSYDWTNDVHGKRFPLCTEAEMDQNDPTTLSTILYKKYFLRSIISEA